MKKPRPTGIGEILETLKKTTTLGQNLEHARIWEQWTELVGPDLSVHGRPQTIKDGQLRIEVDSAVWMHKYSYREWDIVRRVNRMAGKELIHDVFLVLLPDGEAMTDEQ